MGGGGHHWHGHHGGGWGGGPLWSGWGSRWSDNYVPPVYMIEREQPAAPPQPVQYIGIAAGARPRCGYEVAAGLYRCGATMFYDVTRYELKASGLVAKGGALKGLGEDPQARAGAGLLFWGVLAAVGFALVR